MSFYDDMADTVREVLAPDAEGGLGQGEVNLIRVTPGTPDPLAPWEKVEPTTETETLRAAASGVSAEFVGTPADDGSVIIASDIQVISAPPTLGFKPGDRMTIDGAALTILRVDRIPAAGTLSALRFFVRN